MRTLKTKLEIEAMLLHRIEVREVRQEAGKDLKPSDETIRMLMWCLGIPNGWAGTESWFDDVIKGALDCDKCGRSYLACLAQVGLDDSVLCEECKIEEDPIIAMHDMQEVMDHRTDEDGITESFPILVRTEEK